MKCPICDGEGYVYEHITYQGQIEPSEITREICYKCNGTGNVDEPMTNEEWFCGLSTKKKAKWFTENASFINAINQSNDPNKEWNKWLKEVHKEE